MYARLLAELSDVDLGLRAAGISLQEGIQILVNTNPEESQQELREWCEALLQWVTGPFLYLFGGFLMYKFGVFVYYQTNFYNPVI
jgi:hypothetical protein